MKTIIRNIILIFILSICAPLSAQIYNRSSCEICEGRVYTVSTSTYKTETGHVCQHCKEEIEAKQKEESKQIGMIQKACNIFVSIYNYIFSKAGFLVFVALISVVICVYMPSIIGSVDLLDVTVSRIILGLASTLVYAIAYKHGNESMLNEPVPHQFNNLEIFIIIIGALLAIKLLFFVILPIGIKILIRIYEELQRFCKQNKIACQVALGIWLARFLYGIY